MVEAYDLQPSLRSGMKKIIWSWLFAVTAILITTGETQRVLSYVLSPDKNFSVKIIDSALPAADPYTGFCTLVLEHHGKVVSEYPTIGYLLNAFWDPNGALVAINNRRGISGDYLWIVSLKDGKAVKTPDDAGEQAIAGRAAKQYPECDPRALDTSLTEALGWKSPSDLIVRTRLLFNKKTIAIDRTAVYRIDDEKIVLVREDFQRIQWPPAPGMTPAYYSSPVPAEISK